MPHTGLLAPDPSRGHGPRSPGRAAAPDNGLRPFYAPPFGLRTRIQHRACKPARYRCANAKMACKPSSVLANSLAVIRQEGGSSVPEAFRRTPLRSYA